MITGDYNLIKNMNRKLIMEEIIKNSDISRADIAKNTGLNKVTVSTQVAELLESGFLNEKKGTLSNGGKGGKNPILLSIKSDVGYSVGIDLLSSGIKVIVTDLIGGIILRKFIELPEISESKLTDLLINTINQLSQELPDSQYGIIGVSIGVHGHTTKNGFIKHCDNLKLENINLKEKLEQILTMPINVVSNNKLGIIAEKTTYNMMNKCVIYLNMSAGIGGSIVVNNEILDGKDGLGGEFGHMIINTDGKQCHCGNRGCWETYACEKTFLNDLASIKNVEKFTLEDLDNSVTNNDPIVLNALDNLFRYMQVGITNILNIFNPDVIILHNRIVYKYPKLLDKLKIMLNSRSSISIKLSTYEDEGVCIGGCFFNIMNFLKVDQIRKKDEI